MMVEDVLMFCGVLSLVLGILFIITGISTAIWEQIAEDMKSRKVER